MGTCIQNGSILGENQVGERAEERIVQNMAGF